mgnify:CR=1 FL=1
MMWEVEFTNVDNVIRDLEQIDEDRNYGEFCLADVVEWLKSEVYRDILGGITYEDLIFEIKNDIEDGNLDFKNTYNWNGNVTHDLSFAFKEWDGMTYVVMRVHRYGDARCNYTDFIVLEYDNEYQFYESWDEVPSTLQEIEIENGIPVYLQCYPFSEWILFHVDDYNMDGETCCNWLESLVEEITIDFNEWIKEN